MIARSAANAGMSVVSAISATVGMAIKTKAALPGQTSCVAPTRQRDAL
jgi:hypothetical protein